MNLLVVNPGTDIAGCGIALKYAFDRHAPDWTAHHVRRLPSAYDYPSDRPWADLRALWRKADLVHVMDDPRILYRLPARSNVFVQHLGSRFRTQPKTMARVCSAYGARQTAGLDALPYPGVEWLPITYDANACAEARAGYQPSQKVRISHAPTNRALKSTDLIIKAVERLPVTFDLIEHVTNRECLARKAQSDIYVNELTLGYGRNAVECWAIGIPVVSGMTVNRGSLPFDPPWEDATPDTLYDVLLRLVTDAEHRASVALRGLRHVERYHAPQKVVERCLELAA